MKNGEEDDLAERVLEGVPPGGEKSALAASFGALLAGGVDDDDRRHGAHLFVTTGIVKTAYSRDHREDVAIILDGALAVMKMADRARVDSERNRLIESLVAEFQREADEDVRAIGASLVAYVVSQRDGRRYRFTTDNDLWRVTLAEARALIDGVDLAAGRAAELYARLATSRSDLIAASRDVAARLADHVVVALEEAGASVKVNPRLNASVPVAEDHFHEISAFDERIAAHVRPALLRALPERIEAAFVAALIDDAAGKVS